MAYLGSDVRGSSATRTTVEFRARVPLHSFVRPISLRERAQLAARARQKNPIPKELAFAQATTRFLACNLHQWHQ